MRFISRTWPETIGLGQTCKQLGRPPTAGLQAAQVLQATDNTYTSGSPGMGFYIGGTIGVNSDYGFSSFKATDEFTTQTDAAPNPSAQTELKMPPSSRFRTGLKHVHLRERRGNDHFKNSSM